LWLLIIPHVPKIHRSTIISRISNTFLDIIETSYHAYYTSGTEKLEKIIYVNKKLDSMKFLITMTWENKLIQNKQYEEILKELNEIGQMLFGWKRSTESVINKNKTSQK